jgi:hypothetical protein
MPQIVHLECNQKNLSTKWSFYVETKSLMPFENSTWSATKFGQHIGNTSVCKNHFDTHQSLVEVTKKSFKALIEFVVYIHLVNL